MDDEYFKPVKDYEDYYLISNYGALQSLLKKTIKRSFNKNKKGYYRTNLKCPKTNKKKTVFIHQIVAWTYLDNFENKPQINHKDGNKLNNNVSNLEWVTNQENRDHAVKTGLHATRKTGLGKIKLDQIPELKKLAELGYSQRKIGKIFGVCQQTVSKILVKATV